ncbi:MAG: hypothetical protein U0936_20320 [Planctomycetaceae bacterium]
MTWSAAKALTTGGLPEKLRDCRSRDLESTELYSSKVTLSVDRLTPDVTPAFRPFLLRGKILNVEKAAGQSPRQRRNH